GEGGWRAPLAAAAQAVQPPATVPLSGRFAHLALAGREPAVLHVRAATPALTLLARAGGGETAAIHPAGVSLDAYLPAGESQLGFSALGEGELGGFAELTTTAVTPAKEGRGPEVLLPPGDSRYFSFHVASRRQVGWGAGASAERVSCRLLHGDGREVAPRAAALPPHAGPAPGLDLLNMAELEAGDYLLVLTAPPDTAPLRARPVVVGIELPDTGPPSDVIQKYLQRAGAAAPAATAEPGSQQ
ncbi:MAG: hypothetical protein JOZ15_19920, partial [Acidobacteria bacterium]|nr:hypothetical protein [Acidobacteriota bacterium]